MSDKTANTELRKQYPARASARIRAIIADDEIEPRVRLDAIEFLQDQIDDHNPEQDSLIRLCADALDQILHHDDGFVQHNALVRQGTQLRAAIMQVKLISWRGVLAEGQSLNPEHIEALAVQLWFTYVQHAEPSRYENIAAHFRPAYAFAVLLMKSEQDGWLNVARAAAEWSRIT